MPVLQPSPINIQTDEWKEARPHLMRALNYLIKDIYDWIANVQGLGSSPTGALADHDHTAADQGGDYSFGDITASMVAYLAALQTDILVSNVCDKIDNEIISGTWIFGNTSLTLYDTGGDNVLTLKVNEDLSGAKTLNIVIGDADRTITLSGNPTLADWFDQAVKAASSPTFATIKLTQLSPFRVPYHADDATGLQDSILTVSSNQVEIGIGQADTDYVLMFNGETSDGYITWMEDEDYFKFDDDIFLGTEKLYFNGTDTSLYESGDDIHLDTPANKTLVLDEVVYDDIRVTPGAFDLPGTADPALVAYSPGGGGIATKLYEFQVDDIACFTVQIPHGYKVGQDIKVHVHWTPGPRGNEENGKFVGWKVDYAWANIGAAFPAMATAVLTDACNGTDHEHNMTPEATIDGHTVAKSISSMLICNIKRTDTGTDDDWVGTVSGELPMLLEIDFHFPIERLGSRDWGSV